MVFFYHVPCIDHRRVFFGAVKADSENEAKVKIKELHQQDHIYTSQIELDVISLSALDSGHAIKVGTFYS
ncbi:hypothetical protein [Heliomicrobium gestii]|uniref:hypothetical protein n=1 Tax=Heliomicrobium gestii TaxID=2699 RepID=UPI00195ED44C|nr:hypothetical protein [Heliomicrobium gestii]MBM7868219.1 hypothetical protein [Heliomicrobium gestii]